MCRVSSVQQEIAVPDSPAGTLRHHKAYAGHVVVRIKPELSLSAFSPLQCSGVHRTMHVSLYLVITHF